MRNFSIIVDNRPHGKLDSANNYHPVNPDPSTPCLMALISITLSSPLPISSELSSTTPSTVSPDSVNASVHVLYGASPSQQSVYMTIDSSLHVCLLNVHSLVNKLSPFLSFILSFDIPVSILFLWKKGSPIISMIMKLYNLAFSIFGKDRDTRGGSVLVAIANSILRKELPSLASLEVVTISICLNRHITLSMVYSSSNASDEYLLLW